MKRMILILIVIIFCHLGNSLSAQLSDLQRDQILSEVHQLIIKDSLNAPQDITSEQLLNRNLVKNSIIKAIKDNNIGLASDYFSEYAAILDTLVISKPFAARDIVINLSKLYESIPPIMERIAYYSSSIDYYLGFYEKAENELLLFQMKYPTSSLSDKSFTLLLKTYLNEGKENKAFEMIEARKMPLNDEQNYLAGHICFALEKDALAEYYFKKVTSSAFKEDSDKMLTFLSALKEDPALAKSKYENLLQSDPSNPFILLNLARLSSMTGNWEAAKNYYSMYFQAVKSYREFQVHYELASTYLNIGDQQKALEVLDKAILNFELTSYISPLLYLWAEVTANNGNVNLARDRTEKVLKIVDANNRILADKVLLLSRIDDLKTNLGTKLTAASVNSALDELSSISNQLETQNTKIQKDSYGISEYNLNNWMLLEKQIVFSFIEQLNYYLTAEELKDVPDTLHTKQIDALASIYKEQIKRINGIREALLKQNEQNTYLAIRNEIDNNLDVLDKILTNLYKMKSEGNLANQPEKLDSLIAFNERKKIDTTMLLDYYDFDNSDYKTIMEECKVSTDETNLLLKYIAQTKVEFQEKYPLYVSSKEKKLIAQELNQLPLLIPEYTILLQDHQTYLNAVKQNIEFTNIHIAFIETNYYDRERKLKEQSLSFEQSQKLFTENQNRKQIVYNQLTSFISTNSADNSNLISMVNPNINIMASAYFSLAELGNSLWQDQLENNLRNYQKVLELDPKFYLSDAVLYNIGYLSSAITKNRIENQTLVFENKYADSLIKPDSLRYTETAYKESILAYKRIIDEFKESQYYSESMFRLGYLYFEIGTDADRPVEYYQVSRNYYNTLINNPNDTYHYKALYQRGWTWLNSSSDDAYKSAIEDFVVILNAIDQKEISDNTEAVDYSVASIKNIGYCLIGLDGYDNDVESQGALYAKNTLVNKITGDNLNLILDESIDQKLRLYLPMQAIDFMNVKLDLNPLALENPIIADSICALYTRYPNQIRRRMSPENAFIAEKEKIIERYSYNTEWYNANQDKNISRQLQIVRQAFIDVEKRYNNDFVDLPSVANFEKYISLVNQYRTFDTLHDQQFVNWDEQTQTNIIAQNIRLAQLTKAPKHYLALASRIYTFNDANPQNKLYFNLEGTAFDCARIVCDSLKSDIAAIKTQEPDLNLPFGEENTIKYYQLAAKRFINVLQDERFKSPQNDNLFISIVMRQAEIAKDQKQYDVSASNYQLLVNYKGTVPKEIRRTAYINLAEIAEANQNYTEAEKWYRMSEQYALNDADKNILHQYTLVEIQNSIDRASAQEDHKQVAADYIRLSDEYTEKDPNVSLQYKGRAQVAYLDAKDYEKSMSLLLDMANTKTKSNEVFDLYRLAWTIADSIGYHNKADSLKQAFIDKYPSSSEAYQLRLVLIDKQVSDPATVNQAGEAYLTLYDDVKANKANPGNDNPSDLIIAAIAMFDKAGDDIKKEQLAEEFVKQYPDHPSTIRLMEYLADRQLAKGNTQRYEQLSKEIFLKDKTNQLRYANIAKDKLRLIAADFDKAYVTQNWQVALSKIDEFKKAHAAYEKEGLILDFAPVYESFKVAENEYKEEQAKIVFINRFNQQLATIENGILTKSYNQLIRVNNYTKWKRHLVGGENRIGVLKNTTNAEIKKVRQLLEEGAKFDLDVDYRLRAFDLICRIADHSADAINSQIDLYMNTSVEFESFRNQFKNAEEELYSGFISQKNGHIMDVLQQSYPYNLAMYKYFYLPGLKNTYTIRAYNRLVDLNALPKYNIEIININNDWKITQIAIGEVADSQPYLGGISSSTSIDGKRYSRLSIPANSELIIQKNIDLKLPYDYAIANVVTPYFDDTKINLNDKTMEFTFNPIDTLKTGTGSSVRYSLIFGEGNFKAGTNNLEMRFVNYDSNPLILDLNLMAMTDSLKIKAAIPIQTIDFSTDGTWQYANYSPGISSYNWSNAVSTYNIKLSDKQLAELKLTPARMIWAEQKDWQDTTAVIFNKEVQVDGILKEGTIRFIAPDIAVVKINGKELTSSNKIHYDADAKIVYEGQITLSPEDVKQGVNTLQFIIRNHSKWKGLLAEVMMVIALRGDI